MKILLTGQPHSGKTTLLAKIVASAARKQGFVTEEIKKSGVRTGFELVSSDGRRAMLSSTEKVTEYKVSRYFVDVASLDEFIRPLDSIAPNHLLYIDEIGQMELFSESFKNLVNEYIESENDFIGTITNVYSDEFVERLKSRKDIKIIEVTAENRHELLVELKF